MNKPNIFIDGQVGTTGLQISAWLHGRTDIEQIIIPEAERKDEKKRKECLNAADLVFLCLPDDAARESVAMIENAHTKVIDASTAHRVNPEWVYGFPEIRPERRGEIRQAQRVSNPGCHATGYLSIVRPLVGAGILRRDAVVQCQSLTGYSGGGKAMIAAYEAQDRADALAAPNMYGLGLSHKHLPEMQRESGLFKAPIFLPIVGDYYAGMATSVVLRRDMLGKKCKAEVLQEVLAAHYEHAHFITVAPYQSEETLETKGFVAANANLGTNHLEILSYGNEDEILLIARFDNLGKGASGAAVQNMNLMLGFDERAGIHP